MYKRLWMTAESENWMTAQLWVFLGSYMMSMRCLRYGHEENVTISTNSLDELRHTRSVAYSAELVLLNKQQISVGGAYLDCNL